MALHDDELMTEEQAAAVLGWSKRTLQRRRWAGQPPAYVKLGGAAVRYRRRVLEAFIAAGERSSTSSEVPK
jgi:predicted DNA-binding transcriptional regulator AlpA